MFISLMVGLHLSSKGVFTQTIHITTTDTVFVDKPYKEIIIKKVEVPVTVTIYQTDTIYRERLERDTLITFVEITPKHASIHTITPLGKPSINTYPIEDFSNLKINHKGGLKSRKRKRFWKGLKSVFLFTSGVYVGKLIENN